MKKSIAFIVSIVLMLSTLTVIVQASESELTPYLLNAVETKSNFVIDANGNVQIKVSYNGTNGITQGATITTKLQKRFLFVFWNDVDIGTPNNEWVDESTAVDYTNIHTANVPKGTYRVQITYVIRGSGGEADTVNETLEAKY